MGSEQYTFHGRKVVSVYDSSGFGAPDIKDVETGESIDFYTGQPLVHATRTKTLEECAQENDRFV